MVKVLVWGSLGEIPSPDRRPHAHLVSGDGALASSDFLIAVGQLKIACCWHSSGAPHSIWKRCWAGLAEEVP
ncbi:hypothetical protein H2136_04745 [Aeromonas hydrophila]|uniref:Uncharacterized protein n=1 Tax=Aeromonas hydrophila TaxID=644 RepID=A0A926FNL7_AERHY|nr:hypothetical protein [Aeromonas hydrophila]